MIPSRQKERESESFLLVGVVKNYRERLLVVDQRKAWDKDAQRNSIRNERTDGPREYTMTTPGHRINSPSLSKPFFSLEKTQKS